MKPMGMSMFEEDPELELSEDQLKDIKSWDVGKDYVITLRVTMREKELCDDGSIEGCFKINKVSAE